EPDVMEIDDVVLPRELFHERALLLLLAGVRVEERALAARERRRLAEEGLAARGDEARREAVAELPAAVPAVAEIGGARERGFRRLAEPGFVVAIHHRLADDRAE